MKRNNKLSPKQRRKIVEQFRAGKYCGDLVEAFDVSFCTIRYWLIKGGITEDELLRRSRSKPRTTYRRKKKDTTLRIAKESLYPWQCRICGTETMLPIYRGYCDNVRVDSVTCCTCGTSFNSRDVASEWELERYLEPEKEETA